MLAHERRPAHGGTGATATVFCSWGNYDRTHKRLGMAEALRRLGLPLEGTHHRGIDDARNIARILPYALGKQPMPPETHDRPREREHRGRKGRR